VVRVEPDARDEVQGVESKSKDEIDELHPGKGAQESGVGV
jgi:hypothetical protein